MTCLNSNTINVLTTIEGATIGDEVVATNRHIPGLVIRGRLADVGGVALLLETSDGLRPACLRDEWSFTAALPAPASFEPDVVTGAAGPDHDDAEHILINFEDGEAVPGSTVTALLDARRSRIAALEAEVSRLTALAANKQTVIDEDRADAKRNRDLMAAEVADLKHAVALEVNRTNDANQRADELAVRFQELEVETARFEHVIEAAENRIATLLRLNAADDDLYQADTALTEAEELFDAATAADLEAANALDQAKAKLREASAEEKPCSCGTRNTYAMTPGQRVVHRADGPCFIKLGDPCLIKLGDVAAEFGKFEPADLGKPFGKFEPGAAVWIHPQARAARRKAVDAEAKFGKFKPSDLSAYTGAIEEATRLAVAAVARERSCRIRSQEREAERKATADLRDDVRQATEGNQGS